MIELFRWRPRLWLAIWSAGVLWLAVVVINPALSHSQDPVSVAWLLVLLTLEMMIAVGLWLFFALRDRSRAKVAA